MRRTAVLLLALVLLAGCGLSSTTVAGSGFDTDRPPGTDGPTTDPPTTEPAGDIRYPHDADQVIIEVYEGPGGFGPYNPSAQGLPSFRLYGDGRLVASTYRPRTADNGSITPDLLSVQLDGDEVQSLLRTAREAGLDGRDDPEYGDPGVTDQATTDVAVTTDAGTSEGSAYALGIEDDDDIPVSGIDDDQLEARHALSQLIADLDDAADGAEAYEPEGYAVLSYELGSFRQGDARVEVWPLADPATFEPDEDSDDRGCLVVSADDIERLETAVPDALRPDEPIAGWTAPSGTYQLGIRPLLPDEMSCADVLT